MARVVQNPNYDHMLPDLDKHDLVIITFQEVKNVEQCREKLENYMKRKKFKYIKHTKMWEILLICFAKDNYTKLSNFHGKIKTNTKTMGVGNMIGNKGGV